MPAPTSIITYVTEFIGERLQKAYERHNIELSMLNVLQRMHIKRNII
jgi:hypothetical protein